jgi:hypothetical protein
MMKQIFLFIFVLCITGCTNNSGIKTVTVNGTLTQNGKPLTDVRIEFSKIDTGSLSYAETDEQGHFTLIHTHGKKGAESGKYRISVFRKSKPISIPPGQPIPSAPPMTPEVPITMSDKTPIEVEITEKGLNEFIIDLK